MSARARPESSSATASATATASLVKSPPQLPKGSSNRVEKDTSASDIQPADRVNPILDFQDMAPAPSQSFYQIALYPYKKSEARRERRASRASQTSKSPLNKELPELNHEKLERGCIIVREWPRKRFSQGWTREGALNPSEIVLELEDFVGGEMASHITSIFGANRYNQLVTAAQLEVQKKRQD